MSNMGTAVTSSSPYQINMQPTPYNNMQAMSMDQQKEALSRMRRQGLAKLSNFGMLQMGLAFITIVVGGVMMGFAAENIGFPVFNFGPLLVGILVMIGGTCGMLAGRNAHDNLEELTPSVKCYVIAHFAFSVTTISLSVISAVFAFISGAVCSGADIKFTRRRGSNLPEDQIDVKQYCDPNIDENITLAFIGGALCALLFILSILGTMFFCCYGAAFGFKTNTRYRHRGALRI